MTEESKVGFTGEQVDKARSLIASGDIAGVLGMYEEQTKGQVEMLCEDMARASSLPKGAEQWAAVRRPDVLAGIVALCGEAEPIMDITEAAIHWSVRPDAKSDLYEFSRKFWPFIRELTDDQMREMPEGFEQECNKMRDWADRLIEQADNIEAPPTVTPAQNVQLGYLATVGRFAATGKSYVMLSYMSPESLKDGDSLINAMGGALRASQMNDLNGRAMDTVFGAQLLRKVALQLEPYWGELSPEEQKEWRVRLTEQCATAMRKAVPFDLLKAYADGTVRRARMNRGIAN